MITLFGVTLYGIMQNPEIGIFETSKHNKESLTPNMVEHFGMKLIIPGGHMGKAVKIAISIPQEAFKKLEANGCNTKKLHRLSCQ